MEKLLNLDTRTFGQFQAQSTGAEGNAMTQANVRKYKLTGLTAAEEELRRLAELKNGGGKGTEVQHLSPAMTATIISRAHNR